MSEWRYKKVANCPECNGLEYPKLIGPDRNTMGYVCSKCNNERRSDSGDLVFGDGNNFGMEFE